jgi:hypothetical protein
LEGCKPMPAGEKKKEKERKTSKCYLSCL